MNISTLQRPRMVKEIVNHVFDLDIDEKTRKRDWVEARWVYCKILKDYEKMSVTRISMTLNKNHATILHTLKTFDAIYKNDKTLYSMYKKCLRIYLREDGRSEDEIRHIALDEDYFVASRHDNKYLELYEICDTIPEGCIEEVAIRFKAISQMVNAVHGKREVTI